MVPLKQFCLDHGSESNVLKSYSFDGRRQNVSHFTSRDIGSYRIPSVLPPEIWDTGAPRGFGDLGRMAIYFQEAGSTGNYFRGAGKQAHTKVKKQIYKISPLKEKLPFRLIY